jgi:hypothetical protein
MRRRSNQTAISCRRALVLVFHMTLPVTIMACSGDEARAPAASTGKPSKETDASVDDASVPGPSRDAGHTELYADDTFLCRFASSDRLTGPVDVRAHVLRSAANSRGFGQVFQRQDGALLLRAIGITGAAQPEGLVTAASETIEAPSLVASDAGFLLGYRDRVGSRFALRIRDLDDATTPETRISEDIAWRTDAVGRGEPWALTASADGFLVAYRQREDDTHVHVQALDADGQRSDEGHAFAWPEGVDAPDELALASFEEGGYLLAYAHTSTDGSRMVTGQKLDARGNPSPARTLSHSPLSDASMSLSARADSAGLLYPSRDGGLRDALKLRRIDEDGSTQGPELNVAGAPRVVRDGSLAAFGRGYVLVYRELPSLGRSDAQVRIAFVDPYGGVVYDAAIAMSPALPAATSVAAQDDHVLVSWITPAPSGSATVETLRMDCPGALVLCGGRPD